MQNILVTTVSFIHFWPCPSPQTEPGTPLSFSFFTWFILQCFWYTLYVFWSHWRSTIGQREQNTKYINKSHTLRRSSSNSCQIFPFPSWSLPWHFLAPRRGPPPTYNLCTKKTAKPFPDTDTRSSCVIEYVHMSGRCWTPWGACQLVMQQPSYGGECLIPSSST